MYCLTTTEASHWLTEHGMLEDPYHASSAPQHYVQFHAPKSYPVTEAFCREYLATIAPQAQHLLHIADWGLYTPSQMLTISAIRSRHGEDRQLIDTPAHHLADAEADTTIALLSLFTSYEWKGYLYSPHHQCTLYSWEGTYFDFWTDNEHYLSRLRDLANEFNLEITP